VNVRKDHPHARNVALLVSFLIYGVIVKTSFDSKFHTRAEQVFGSQPLGITPRAFALMVQTVLFVPFPWVYYHCARLILQARRDGFSVTGLFGIVYLFEADRLHPHLRRSKRICLAGLAYFVLICSAWIAYTALLGN